MNCLVILNYNNCEETLHYVRKIKNYKCLDKIIIVDNASSDCSLQSFEKIVSRKIHLVKNKINLGYNAGNNSGVIYAQKKFPIKKIIISNPDIHIDEKDMDKILDDLESYSLVAPIIYDLNGNIQSNCGWRLPSYSQSLANCSLISYKIQKIFGKSNYFSAINYVDRYVPVEAVSGCFFGITNEAFNLIGGFDEDIFLYGEEIILGYQLKTARLKSVIDKECIAIHEDQGSKMECYKKWKRHRSLIKKSHIVYLDKCLNVGKPKLALYVFIYTIGSYLNRFIDKIYRNIGNKYN